MKQINHRIRIQLTNFTSDKSLFRVTALVLVAFSFFQLPTGAQPLVETNETTVVGKTVALLGLARGNILRYTAFNPIKTDSGERNDPIRLRLKLYDERNDVIAESAEVEIPPGEFRYVDFNRDDLPVAGEPGTARAQFRTQALWGLRTLRRISVATSLEVMDSSTTGTFKFYFNVETLP